MQSVTNFKALHSVTTERNYLKELYYFSAFRNLTFNHYDNLAWRFHWKCLMQYISDHFFRYLVSLSKISKYIRKCLFVFYVSIFNINI